MKNSKATTPRKKLPWNFHQPRTPGWTCGPHSGFSPLSLPATPRISANKENLLDSSPAASGNYLGASSAAAITVTSPQPSLLSPSASTADRRLPTQHNQRRSNHSSYVATAPAVSRSESMTCSDLLKEALASGGNPTSRPISVQQPPDGDRSVSDANGGGDHVTAMRDIIVQLTTRVAHRPDCVALVAEIDRRLTRLEGDVGVVTGQLMEENRALRARARRAEAALAALQADAAARAARASGDNWGRREAALLARLQVTEAARVRGENRAAALEAELGELLAARHQQPNNIPSIASSNAHSNAPTPLTTANLVRHGVALRRLYETQAEAAVAAAAVAATTDDNIDHDARSVNDCAVTSVSQQVQQQQQQHQSRVCAASSGSPPTLDSAPVSGLPSIPARYPAQPAQLPPSKGNLANLDLDDDLDLEDDDDLRDGGANDSDEDEAAFRRGLARIEEQIVRLQTSLGSGNSPGPVISTTTTSNRKLVVRNAN